MSELMPKGKPLLDLTPSDPTHRWVLALQIEPSTPQPVFVCGMVRGPDRGSMYEVTDLGALRWHSAEGKLYIQIPAQTDPGKTMAGIMLTAAKAWYAEWTRIPRTICAY